MVTLSRDTAPDVERMQIEHLRRLPTWRKLALVGEMNRMARLTPGQRIQRMLDARELAVGLIRGRLCRRYPDLTSRELNLKVLEEIERAQRTSR